MILVMLVILAISAILVTLWYLQESCLVCYREHYFWRSKSSFQLIWQNR